MAIEQLIGYLAEKFSFSEKNLPEFINKEKFLEEKLKRGEELSIVIVNGESKHPYICLELCKKEETIKIATFNYSGITQLYQEKMFEDYLPLPEWGL